MVSTVYWERDYLNKLTIFASCYKLLKLVTKLQRGPVSGVPWWLFVRRFGRRSEIGATGLSQAEKEG